MPSTSNHDYWYYDGQSIPNDSLLPDMYRSDTGYAPCNQCSDNTVSYRFNWWYCNNNVQYFPDSPCHCKIGYKSPNGLAPCQQCSPGSSTRNYINYCGYNVNSYTTGSSVCNCMQGYFSLTGNDNDGPCQKCPTGTSTIELNTGNTFIWLLVY